MSLLKGVSGMQPEITIRRPHTPGEYQSLQEAQKRAWGITQDGYVVPVARLVPSITGAWYWARFWRAGRPLDYRFHLWVKFMASFAFIRS